MYLVSILFLLTAAVSMSGWGSLVLRGEGDWSRKFGAGVLVVFLTVTFAGWTGLLREPLLWGILAAGAGLWVRPGKFIIPAGLKWLALAGAILVPLAVLPPISRDAMVHHLMLPRLWLEAGRMVRPDWLAYFSYPNLVETLYAFSGGTFGFGVSRMVSLLGFLAVCSVPVGLYLSRGDRRTALLSLLVLFSIPELFRNATWSYSDSFLVFFSLLAYVELVDRKGSPLAAVLWAGAAGCCKYNGAVVLLTVCVLLPFFHRKMSVRTLLTCGAVALGTSAIWAVPNIIQWGNPVYPLFRGIFGPASELTSRGAEYLSANAFSSAVSGPLDYLLLPVRMSLSGKWDDASLFDGASGPLLLIGSVIAVAVAKGRRRKLIPPLVFLVVAVAIRGGALRTRYLLPGLAMLALPAAEAFANLLRSGISWLRVATAALIGICLLWSGSRLMDLYVLERPWELPGREEYLETNTAYYPFYTDCEGQLSDSDTTLLVNMVRPFYFPGPVRTTGHRVPVELLELLWSGADGATIANSLASDGITHIAMDMVYTSLNLTPELSGEEMERWREFAACRLEPVVASDRFVLLRLVP